MDVMATKLNVEDAFRREERLETKGGSNKTQDQVLLSVRVREHIESIHSSSQPLVQKEDSD